MYDLITEVTNIKVSFAVVILFILLAILRLITSKQDIEKSHLSKIKPGRYFQNLEVFTDRETSMQKLQFLIDKKSLIINVHGKSGIGKRTFLEYFCDYVNNTLLPPNKNYSYRFKKILKIKRNKAFYVELTNIYDANVDIKSAISQSLGSEKNDSIESLAKRLSFNYRWWWIRKIYIVISNVSNTGLYDQIAEIIHTFIKCDKRNKFCIIISSSNQLRLDRNKVHYLSLNLFDEKNIYEYAKKNAENLLTSSLIQRIARVSEGLPIFVKILMSHENPNLAAVSTTTDELLSYVSKILKNLNYKDMKVIVCITLFSITNQIIRVDDLEMILKENIKSSLRNLQLCSLIEYNEMDQYVKVHEILRNCIIDITHGEIRKKSILLEEFYEKKDDTRRRLYYLLMMESSEKLDQSIADIIESALNQEDYSFLILVGEHFDFLKRIYVNLPALSDNALLHLVWGILEGHLGTGNYPAARDLINRCKISVRDHKTLIQFKISLAIANLDHLQNKYEEAVATYTILLKEIEFYPEFACYESICLWGIAHSYRHEGCDLKLAITYYEKAIMSSKRTKSRALLLKCYIEEVIIFDCWGNFKKSQQLLSIVNEELSNFDESLYVSTRISLAKMTARHMRISQNKSTEAEYNILNKVLDDYEKIRKRLQYNTLFELGEHFRKMEAYDLAYRKYNEALHASEINYDFNLNTMSKMGMILCELYSREKMGHQDNSYYLASIIKIINDCTTYNLHTNKCIAEIILSFIQNKTRVDRSIELELQNIGYYRESVLCRNLSMEGLKQLNLILM